MRVYHKYIQQGLYTPANATSLLIGTFPSILIREAFGRRRSTDVDFFYGSADNNFWKDLGIIYKRQFRQDHSPEAIHEREHLLNDLRMGLSDCILSCETNGSAMDLALQNIEMNTTLVTVLDQYPTITTLYFTSSSGKTNAETGTLKILRDAGRLSKMKIKQKSGPRIRSFIFLDMHQKERTMKTITLYSPSPLAEQWGVTPEKRLAQYKEYLPKLSQ
jgi:G:T/U-mismatch repair DNA glycosylase